MPEYKVILTIKTEMGDPNKWDWEQLIVTDPEVETLVDVDVIDLAFADVTIRY